MDTKNTESEYEGFKKKGKVIAKILIIIGPFLVIGGIVSLILSFVSGASMDMDFDEFASAMELEGDLAFLGIGLLAGGSFMIIFGIWALFRTQLRLGDLIQQSRDVFRGESEVVEPAENQ